MVLYNLHHVVRITMSHMQREGNYRMLTSKAGNIKPLQTSLLNSQMSRVLHSLACRHKSHLTKHSNLVTVRVPKVNGHLLPKLVAYGRLLSWSAYYRGALTIVERLLSWSAYYRGALTIVERLLSWSAYYRGALTIVERLLSWSAYYRGALTIVERLLSWSAYYRGALTIVERLLSWSAYYRGALTIVERLLSWSAYYRGALTFGCLETVSREQNKRSHYLTRKIEYHIE